MWLKETASGITHDWSQIFLQAHDVVTVLIVFATAGGRGPTVGRDGTAWGNLTAPTLVPQTLEVNCKMTKSIAHGLLFFSDETGAQSSYCISQGGEI